VLAAYVTGHGFGHATRTACVLREVRLRDAELPIVVTTSAPFELFEGVVAPPLRLRRVECDVGLAQKDALTIDLDGTARRWREFARGLGARAADETEFLRSTRTRVVLGDVPPLAFLAAAAAGVPGVALANFSWDWIYRHYAAGHLVLGEAAEVCADAYRRSSLLLRLPFAGDLGAFPKAEDIPLVCRRPRFGRLDARRRLALPPGRLALLSFGGIGMPGFRYEALADLDGVVFVLVGERAGSLSGVTVPGNVHVVDRGAMTEAGLGYEDLVGAVDVVVTKPGYGIVSDAIGAGTPLVYTDRGDFPEYPIIVEEMKRWLPCAYVANDDLLAGRLRAPIESALRTAVPEPPRRDGAAVAAERLLGL
jgi:L-arabinokinase